MTKPPHMPLLPVDPAQIAAIWEAHRLGPLERIAPLPGAARNTSFLINDELVLRLNTRDPGFVKFGNEQIAYRLLADSGLPLPRVVVLDERRTVVPYDFIVLTRLPGTSIAASRAALSAGQQRALAWQAGSSLARLHQVTFSSFGPLHKLEQQPFPSWAAYFDDYAQRYMQAAAQARLIDAALTQRLEAARGAAGALLARISQGVLVHSDFHYDNLLQLNGVLSGLLDFEWSLAGDPSADFAMAHMRAAMLPGSEAVFTAGYQSVRPFDAEHSQRATLYRLFLWLEDAVVEAAWQNRPAAAAALAQMVELLEEVERRAQR